MCYTIDMKRAFKTYFWLIIVVLVAAASFSGGFYYGIRKGEQRGQIIAESQYLPLIDYAFPRPPVDLRSFTGTVKNVYGAELSLEIRNPDDYLPHLDGSPYAIETRTASVSSETQMVRIDTTQLDQNGNAIRTPLQLSDLKEGDRVTVFAKHNIRDAQQFDVARIELVRY